MKSKRIVSALCAAGLLIGMTGLGAAAQDELTQFEPTSDNVRQIGRTYYNGEELWFGLTDSGIAFDFTGKYAEINLMGDDAAWGEENGARIKAYADGEVVYDKCLTEYPFETIKINFDSEGEHNVRLLKVSECANNTVLIENIFTDSKTISPTGNGSHTIEFVGDSITCGYGVDADSQNEHFLTSTEDGTKTYAYKTAAYFNADYSMVSYSGCGAISGYTGNGKVNADNLMKNFYEHVGHQYSSNGGKKLDEIDWEFKKSPELIVVNLGTNDNSYTRNDNDKKEEFKTAYTDLLKQIRSKNPDSELLCVLGLMGQELYPSIEEAVESYKSETGDTKINTFALGQIDASTEGYGADYHPKEASHERASKELIGKIEELYGWTDHDPAIPEDKPAAADSSSAAEQTDINSSKSSSLPLIVGISAGVLALAAVVIVVISRKKKS